MILEAVVLGYLRRNPLRAALNVAAIALGVGFSLAIGLGSEQALRSLNAGAASLGAPVDLAVYGPAFGVDARYLGTIRYAPGVARASPVIERSITAHCAAATEPLRLAGVDLLAPLPGVIGAAQHLPGPYTRTGTPFDPAATIARGGAILPSSFAKRCGLRGGARLSVTADGRTHALPIAYVLPAHAIRVDPGVIFVDVATAQTLFGEAGRFDRIDVIASEPPERLRARLAPLLPPSYLIDASGESSGALGRLLAYLARDFAILEYVLLAVAAALVSSSIGASVAQRRTEIGTVRMLGATRQAVLAAFLSEGFWLGVAGAILGAIAGELAAPAVFGVFAKYGDVRAIPPLMADLKLDARACALGIAAAILAAVPPGIRAARMTPALAMTAYDPGKPRAASRTNVDRIAERVSGWSGIALRLAVSNVRGGGARLTLAIAAFVLAIATATAYESIDRSLDTALDAWGSGALRGVFAGGIAVMRALEAALLLLALAAIATAFGSLVVERRHQLRILRQVGVTRSLLGAAVMIEVVFVTLIAALAGAAAGYAAAAARLLFVDRDAFGGTATLASAASVGQILLFALGAAAVAGLLAARSAAGIAAES